MAVRPSTSMPDIGNCALVNSILRDPALTSEYTFRATPEHDLYARILADSVPSLELPSPETQKTLGSKHRCSHSNHRGRPKAMNQSSLQE